MENQTVVRHFAELGVRVTIPEQVGDLIDQPLIISDPLPYPIVESKSRDEFELIRLVINFQVEDGQGVVVKGVFNPPMMLEVGLTPYDFGQLEKGKTLTLAFWDENDGEWIVFADQWLGNREATHIVAKAAITQWGDPAVGVGR